MKWDNLSQCLRIFPGNNLAFLCSFGPRDLMASFSLLLSLFTWVNSFQTQCKADYKVSASPSISEINTQSLIVSSIHNCQHNKPARRYKKLGSTNCWSLDFTEVVLTGYWKDIFFFLVACTCLFQSSLALSHIISSSFL